MSSHLGVFICIFAIIVVAVQGDDRCTPGLVQNVTFHDNYYLNWTKAFNPNNCYITGYVVNVTHMQDNRRFQIQTATLYFNFDFLDMCETYYFEIAAITDSYVLGPVWGLEATTPPLPNMNLALDLSYHINNASLDVVNLNWTTRYPQVSKCVSYYRVVYWDQNNAPTDVYVTKQNFTKTNLIPCMQYHFQVNAVVNNPDSVGPTNEVVLTGTPQVPSIPQLVSMTVSSNAVTMLWRVPAYNENRCQLTSLRVVTIGAPTNRTSVVQSIQDMPLRPDVLVVVDSLSPSHVYQSNVELVNTAGSSRNVSVSFQTAG